MSTSPGDSLAPPAATVRGPSPVLSILKEASMKILDILRRSARAYAEAAATGALPGQDPTRFRNGR